MKDKEISLNIKNLFFQIISITFIVTTFVCILCNYIINHELTWSLYPVGSCVFVWITLLPLLKFKKRGILSSVFIFSLLIIPFLALIEYLCPIKNWLIPLGIPNSITSTAYLWIVGLLLIKSKLAKWYVASVATLLSIPLAIVINVFVSRFLHESFDLLQTIIHIILSLSLALGLFFLGNRKNK